MVPPINLWLRDFFFHLKNRRIAWCSFGSITDTKPHQKLNLFFSWSFWAENVFVLVLTKYQRRCYQCLQEKLYIVTRNIFTHNFKSHIYLQIKKSACRSVTSHKQNSTTSFGSCLGPFQWFGLFSRLVSRPLYSSRTRIWRWLNLGI